MSNDSLGQWIYCRYHEKKWYEEVISKLINASTAKIAIEPAHRPTWTKVVECKQN